MLKMTAECSNHTSSGVERVPYVSMRSPLGKIMCYAYHSCDLNRAPHQEVSTVIIADSH